MKSDDISSRVKEIFKFNESPPLEKLIWNTELKVLKIERKGGSSIKRKSPIIREPEERTLLLLYEFSEI
jgi:hypothetical protein